MSDMKKCSKCGIEKDEREFYKNKQMKDGLCIYCKTCRRTIDHDLYIKYSTESKIRQKDYYHQCIHPHKKTKISEIQDRTIINEVLQMNQNNIPISDISKEMSCKYGLNITKISICRVLQSFPAPDNPLIFHTIPSESDYPSRKEIENLFSDLLKKENDFICIYGGEQLKRKLMFRIYNAYIFKEFTYLEVKNALNTWVNDDGFRQHWNYLLDNHYIEQTENEKFKFWDGIKKWRTWGKKCQL